MRSRSLLAGLVAIVIASACATIDQFNKAAANITHDAIVASEQQKCSVHAAPCLSDAQFVQVNLELHKVSVAGDEFTKLRIDGKATIADVHTFLAVVAEETAILAKAFPDGVIGDVLKKLAALQVKVSARL